jgi:alkaline phosphatase D
MLGDAIYADRENGGQYVKHPGPVAIAASYDLLNQVKEFKRFQSEVPILVTWDDHDLGKNDAGSEFPYRKESKDLMLDFFGVDAQAAVRSRDGIYSSKVFGSEGRRVQVILLDTRWFRSRPVKTDEYGKTGKERYVPTSDPSKTMLGDVQWAWLEEQLNEPADVRILASSQQIIADAHGWEAWRNFPLEREKLYGLIESTGAEGVVILSGDRHVGGIYENSNVGNYPLIEVTSSALNKSFAKTSDEEGPYQVGRLYAPNNFGLVEIDWAARSLEVGIRNEDGISVRKLTVPLDTLKPLPKEISESH